MLKSPSKKVVLFSFVMLSNNLFTYFSLTSLRSIVGCRYTTPRLLDVDILHQELYLIFWD